MTVDEKYYNYLIEQMNKPIPYAEYTCDPDPYWKNKKREKIIDEILEINNWVAKSLEDYSEYVSNQIVFSGFDPDWKNKKREKIIDEILEL